MLDDKFLIFKNLEKLLLESDYTFGEILYYLTWNSKTGVELKGQGRLTEVPDSKYYKILNGIIKKAKLEEDKEDEQ